MNRDFFVKVVFGTHRVADHLANGAEIKELVNKVLADLLLFCQDIATLEQKKNILPITLRKIDMLLVAFNTVKNSGAVDQKNFVILENEYKKISKILVDFLEQNKQEKKEEAVESEIPQRQRKILELLKNKEKTQVWELQKVLPEVTKRTLRRDLDNLLGLHLIERKGEWNNVFYIAKI